MTEPCENPLPREQSGFDFRSRAEAVTMSPGDSMRTWQKVALGVVAVVGVGGLGVFALAGYQVATAESSMRFPDTPYPDVHASSDPAVIERGRYLAYGPAQCVHCHGGYEREHPEAMKATPPPALSGGITFDMGPIG